MQPVYESRKGGRIWPNDSREGPTTSLLKEEILFIDAQRNTNLPEIFSSDLHFQLVCSRLCSLYPLSAVLGYDMNSTSHLQSKLLAGHDSTRRF